MLTGPVKLYRRESEGVDGWGKRKREGEGNGDGGQLERRRAGPAPV
jgi:hypothetical protein